MKSDWWKGLSEEEKLARVEMVMTARPTLDVLRKLLEVKLDARLKQAEQKSNYENASWPYMQADAIAEQRTLREIIELLTLTKDDK